MGSLISTFGNAYRRMSYDMGDNPSEMGDGALRSALGE